MRAGNPPTLAEPLTLVDYCERLAAAGCSGLTVYRQGYATDANGTMIAGHSWWIEARLTKATHVSVTAADLGAGFLAVLEMAEKHSH